MKRLKDQLSSLPQIFTEEMEKQKEDRWSNIYNYIINMFDCEDDINNIIKAGVPIDNFFKRFYELGFYSGVNFTLDPDSPYDSKEGKII